MKGIKKQIRTAQGFTLVEIIVVLVILAILAAFTIPTMLGFVNDARGKAYIAEAREVYVAAQTVATELSATTDIPDANVANTITNVDNPIVHTNVGHATGLATSISSYEVQARIQNTNVNNNVNSLMGKSPQWRASRQMDSYLNKDYNASATNDSTRIKISNINLLTTTVTTSRPTDKEAAWIVTINSIPDTANGITDYTRTGKVTKVVYYRNGYKVTIEGNNATVARYK